VLVLTIIAQIGQTDAAVLFVCRFRDEMDEVQQRMSVINLFSFLEDKQLLCAHCQIAFTSNSGAAVFR